MANELTGDYEVVAAFSLGAVNRILAAMHRGKRLPHSLSMAVDDIPQFRLGAIAVSVVDKYGEAVADMVQVRKTAYAPLVMKQPLTAEQIVRVDPVVNWRADPKVIAAEGPGIAGSHNYSYLQGVAQLQLGPPIMMLPANRTDSADIHTPAMIRYLADPSTRALSEFMRGEIVTSFGVKRVASAAGTTIVVDTVGPQGNVHFNSAWSAEGLDAADHAAIDKALHNVLRKSFQPSSTPLPTNTKRIDFKGFPAQGAVGLLMNLSSADPASPNSVGAVFLRGDDQFAMAINGDSIAVPMAAAVDASVPRVTNFPDRYFRFSIAGYSVVNCTVHSKVTVGAASVVLIPDIGAGPGFIPGKIVLTIPAHVNIWWEGKPSSVSIPSGFDIHLTQVFTLAVYGRNVSLERQGDVGVTYSGDTWVRVPVGSDRNLQDDATPLAKNLFNQGWAAQEAAIQDKINKSLSADVLQGFLQKLMNPASPSSPFSDMIQYFGKGADPDTLTELVKPNLQYTSVEMRASGIVLHGSLSVPAWSGPSVRFEKDPWSTTGKPEYEALKSWIPGGTVKQYKWQFYQNTLTDANRFATVNAPALTLSHVTVCLNISGSRITASGPIAYEQVVSNRVCRLMGIPLISWRDINKYAAANRPQVIVPKPIDPGGPVEQIGHASPWVDDHIGGVAANLVVYFPDSETAERPEFLVRALAQSGRADTPTATICVHTVEQAQRARTVEGVMYADDSEAWERMLGVRQRPAAAIVSPGGEVRWQKQGSIGETDLSAALREHLDESGKYAPRFLGSRLRPGELSPNFVFESAPEEELTLRKVSGKRTALVFFRSTSAPSVATVSNVHRALSQQGVEAGVVIAVCDGEDGEFARGFAAGEEGETIVVPDSQRLISRAYGITMWPTVVFLDTNGMVEDVHFGTLAERELLVTLESKPAREKENGKC